MDLCDVSRAKEEQYASWRLFHGWRRDRWRSGLGPEERVALQLLRRCLGEQGLGLDPVRKRERKLAISWSFFYFGGH